MKNKISCRDSVYQGWKTAIEYLPKAGIKYIEINIGGQNAEELKGAADACRAKGVTPLTISGSLDTDDQKMVEQVRGLCVTAKEMGVPGYFLSVHGKDRASAMKVVRELGDHAKANGVTILMETHPPFCRNADDMLLTMAATNHENVKINFDTANIFYYNKNIDSADELDKVVNYVRSLHLKDTDGGFESPNFPVLGKGVVQFPRIFKTLHSAGFDGPLTMEIEGALVEGLGAEGYHKTVIECMDYLRKIGEDK